MSRLAAWALIVTLVAAAAAVSVDATWPRHHHACRHGESSIRATRVHGRLHVSRPHVTGCTP